MLGLQSAISVALCSPSSTQALWALVLFHSEASHKCWDFWELREQRRNQTHLLGCSFVCGCVFCCCSFARFSSHFPLAKASLPVSRHLFQFQDGLSLLPSLPFMSTLYQVFTRATQEKQSCMQLGKHTPWASLISIRMASPRVLREALQKFKGKKYWILK